MAPKIERVTENCVLGEGPHWDVESQSLYFVDVYGKNLQKYNTVTKKVTKVSVAPKQPSIIIPVSGKKDDFLVALNNELVIISWDGESDTFSTKETLYAGDNSPEKKNHKFNDGKCDSSGRLWIGTYGSLDQGITNVPPVGTLYSFDSRRNLKGHVDKLRITNGLAFNQEAKKMYHIDTLKGTVDQFDFDVDEGSISNRQVLFTLNKHDISGFPDGMTIDTDGNLWVATFNGNKIIKIDGTKPESLLQGIEIPNVQVTSLAFGGLNLDELYATSGDFGGTYRVAKIGARGFPGARFKVD